MAVFDGFGSAMLGGGGGSRFTNAETIARPSKPDAPQPRISLRPPYGAVDTRLHQ